MLSRKKYIFIGIVIVLYGALCYATQLTALSPSIRHAIAAFLPLTLLTLASGIIIYAAWSTWRYRSTQAILLLVTSLIMTVTVMPVWIWMVRYHTNAALHQLRKAPVASSLPPQPSPEIAPEDRLEPVVQPQSDLSKPAIPTPEVPELQEPVVEKKKTAPAGVLTITSQEKFDELISKNNPPALVQCSATWCQPCQMMKPIFKKVAQEFEGKITFIALDADTFNTKALRVRGLPTYIGFKNGHELFRFYGPESLENVRDYIKKLLK